MSDNLPNSFPIDIDGYPCWVSIRAMYSSPGYGNGSGVSFDVEVCENGERIGYCFAGKFQKALTGAIEKAGFYLLARSARG